MARLKFSKTTRNFPKTTSLATRQEIPKNDQFTDQDFQITKKRPGNFDLRPGIFSQVEKFEKNFYQFCMKNAILPLFFDNFDKS